MKLFLWNFLIECFEQIDKIWIFFYDRHGTSRKESKSINYLSQQIAKHKNKNFLKFFHFVKKFIRTTKERKFKMHGNFRVSSPSVKVVKFTFPIPIANLLFWFIFFLRETQNCTPASKVNEAMMPSLGIGRNDKVLCNFELLSCFFFCNVALKRYFIADFASIKFFPIPVN